MNENDLGPDERGGTGAACSKKTGRIRFRTMADPATIRTSDDSALPNNWSVLPAAVRNSDHEAVLIDVDGRGILCD